MYKINEKAGIAMEEKGYATMKDFPALSLWPGKKFVAWFDGKDWNIETTLCGGDFRRAVNIFEKNRASNYYVA